MQDTKNLKKKMSLEYPRLIKSAGIDGDRASEAFWQRELYEVSHKINLRKKNKRKNEKQFRKSN